MDSSIDSNFGGSPASYADLDRFPDLAFSEALLVWGLRVWVDIANPHDGPGAPLAMDRLRTAFDHVGAPSAALQLDAFWSLIGASAKRQIDVRCTGCVTLSRDELLFLREIACRQRLVTPGPSGLLASVCPAAARRHAAPLAQALATSLELARLLLPARPDGLPAPACRRPGTKAETLAAGANAGIGQVVTLH